MMDENVNRAALEKIADALEAPTMPKNFEWQFTEVFWEKGEDCGTVGCAIGLGVVIGAIPATCLDRKTRKIGLSGGREVNQVRTSEFLGVEVSDYHHLFYGLRYTPIEQQSPVRPQAVAIGIRNFLEGKEPLE